MVHEHCSKVDDTRRSAALVMYAARGGMAAVVMSAAQLQNADVPLELLRHEAGLQAVDDQGHDAVACAGSLPSPAFMDRTVE
jgi:hypothetical protein